MDPVVRKQLSTLIQLAKIDRNLAPEERDLITKIANRYHVSRNELDQLFDRPDPIGSLNDLTPDQKMEYLAHIVQLAKADRRIMPNEVLFCQDIARRLGYKPRVLQALIPLVNEKTIESENFPALRRKLSPYF